MNDKDDSAQLAVIGAGPGGYAAAFLAADLGLKVTLIGEEENPGGVCLYWGCIPSKALLHAARVIADARQAARWGIQFAEPRLDVARLRSWKGDVVRKLTAGLGLLGRQREVRYIRGRASFLDGRTLKIEKHDGGEQQLAFEKAILATGSRPATLPGISLRSARLLDSTAALELNAIPKTMLVAGGGYIGLEIGSIYATLGTKVSLVEMTPGLLPGVDRDLVSILSKRIEGLFHSVMLDTKVVGMKEENGGIRAQLEGAGAGAADQMFESVLVAVGRKPNSEIAGLKNTRVELDARGFVKVDGQRRTADPNIYAIGDVAGEPLLAHKATHEGRTAAEVISGRKVAFEPRAIPAVVFTDPEVAWCGLTESRAKDEGLRVKVVRFPWGASGRAATLDRQDGVTKLILDAGNGQVLGMGIVGPGAGELIAEGVLAVEMGALASDVMLSIHPHPTLSETVMEAAEAFFGQSTHIYRPRKD
ncbi:MAG: dihydrolipoyl dehydrogenase [Acidobacteriia bacterium]|nr:dihydrolipoyl dehydrogenase [Terriglobia bacterium]